MKKVVLIFGASSGIGLACAKIFLEKGYQVVNCSRQSAPDEQIENYQVDVTNTATIDTAIQEIKTAYSRIDIMLYSSGTSMAAPIDKVMQTDYEYLFDVNVNGAIYAVKKVVPIMKNNGGGQIVLISSLASVAPIPYDPYYCASKAAINAFVVALATEIDRFNISISNVLPGGVKTNFSFERKIYKDEDANLKRASQSLFFQEQNGMSAESVARKVYKTAIAKKPPLLVVPGLKNKLIYISCKLLPLRLLKQMSKVVFKIKK